MIVVLALMVAMSTTAASAVTVKLAMDADPVSLDPQVQLSGGILQYSHMIPGK